MSDADPAPADAARLTRRVVRRHTAALLLLAIASMLAAWPIRDVNASPIGRDAFYVAIAWQFAIWGAIDALFAIHGLVGVARAGRADASAAETMRTGLLRALAVSRRLNGVYLLIGVALLIWGFIAQSPALCGHGVGVLVQAALLVAIDESFVRGLRRVHAR